jgi:hypothetical protein
MELLPLASTLQVGPVRPGTKHPAGVPHLGTESVVGLPRRIPPGHLDNLIDEPGHFLFRDLQPIASESRDQHFDALSSVGLDHRETHEMLKCFIAREDVILHHRHHMG